MYYLAPAAGAIKAVASTGRHLMPSFMGAAVFIVAEFTSTAYQKVVKAAFLSAVALYGVLPAIVHFEPHFCTARIQLSGGQLPVTLVFTMMTGLILGAGLQTAAAYFLVGARVTLALVDMGVRL